MGSPAAKVRELCAHMLQLCHYVQDLDATPAVKAALASSTTDLDVILKKAKQVEAMVNGLYEE